MYVLCSRLRGSADICIQPHFEPIIRPWTDVSLGQCSYLNMCYGEVRFLLFPTASAHRHSFSAPIHAKPVSGKRKSISFRSNLTSTDNLQLVGAEAVQVYTLSACAACLCRNICGYPGKGEKYDSEA